MKKGTSKKRTPLSSGQILIAAVRLADENGIGSLSMRSLAAAVRVEAMSLYNHVKNKEEILDGMVDLVAGEFSAPETGGDWKAEMRRRSRSAHEVLMRHPWATMLIVSRINIGPAMLRYVDATIGCLREAGFSYPMADHAWNAIDSHIYGFTLQKLNFPFSPDEYSETAQAHMSLIPADQYPYLNGMAQQVAAGEHDGIQDFEFGLELILEGLERLRNRP